MKSDTFPPIKNGKISGGGLWYPPAVGSDGTVYLGVANPDTQPFQVVQLTKLQILQQAGTAMLAQANTAPQTVLTLLRGS